MLYMILALAGLLPTAWLVYRRRDPLLAATYFVAAALVHTADWVASGVLGLYKYHPGLFSDLILDDAAGVVLAELIFVAAFAVWLVASIPSWWGALAGALVVTALELFFQPRGLLEYQGWQIYFTGAGFVVYFTLIRLYWLSARRRGLGAGWPRWVVRLSVAVAGNGVFEIILWASKAIQFLVTVLPSMEKNQALLRMLWHAGIGVPLAYWTLAGARPVWPLRLLAALAASIALNQLSVVVGFRSLNPPWNPIVVGLLQTVFFALACLVGRYLTPQPER